MPPSAAALLATMSLSEGPAFDIVTLGNDKNATSIVQLLKFPPSTPIIKP
jgi:hypothetical protein